MEFCPFKNVEGSNLSCQGGQDVFTTFKCPAVISRCYRIIVVIYADISHFCVGWFFKLRYSTLEIDSFRYLLPEMEKLAEAA